MRTIFIKVPVSERLPEKRRNNAYIVFMKIGGTLTLVVEDDGDIEYLKEHYSHWLEERELPSEEEIDIMAKIHGKSNVINVPILDWKIGANYILSKIFKTK